MKKPRLSKKRVGRVEPRTTAGTVRRGASTAADFRQMVGALLRKRREDLGLTLDRVAQLAAAHPLGRPNAPSPAHISRIENGHATPSILEAHLLNEVLHRPLGPLLQSDDAPWFIVRDRKVRERLREVLEGRREVQRTGSAHQRLIARGVYRYVPLIQSPEYVDERDQYGTMTPYVSVNRFLVSRADPEWMNEPEALSSHEGEEIIYVLSGEVEFWYQTAGGTEPTTRKLHPGDCLHFSSRLNHGFRAIGAGDAEALFVYAMPPDASIAPAVKDKKPVRKRNLA